MKFAYVVNNHFLGGDKLYCMEPPFPLGDLYRPYSGALRDGVVFQVDTVKFVTGPYPNNRNPIIYLNEGVRNFKVSAEFYYKYSVITSAVASGFKGAGINSAKPSLRMLCETQNASPNIYCGSNIPYRPSKGLTLVSDKTDIPWSAISADYMNNINTNNLSATIYDNNIYSASWSAELNYTYSVNYSMDNFWMEEGQVQFPNQKGFLNMRPGISAQTNLYFSPSFDSYSSSPSWTYYTRS